MAGDDVNIVVTATTAQANRAFRDLRYEVRHLRGTLIPLAAAAAPLAAALTPIAVKAAGAGTAVAAFGAAVAGQVSHLSDAVDAQDKYTDAVAKYGRGSKQAAEAQRMLSSTLSTMPQATARAAVAVSSLKTEFKGWSDELAGFTMTPVEKSITLLGRLIPKLTPMVKGASSQLDRLVTVAGGAMATPGFDALADKVSTFANQSLKDAVDGAIHFARALSEGNAGGPIRTFMEYAEKNGPVLRETLRNVGDAVMTLVKASAEAGPGMLTLVNAGLKLVAALPPGLVATVMQLAVALKAVKLAGAGITVVATGIQAFGTRLLALQAASAAAGGGLAGLRAAFLSLNTAARATVVVAGIAAVATAFGKLASLGREAPPDVDKLTTSLGQLGRTGHASGEAARLFGKDLDGLYESVRNITDPTTTDKIQQGLVKVFSLGIADSTPHTEAKKRLDAIDEGLTTLVKGGKADIAAAAFKRLSKEYVDGGGSLKDFKGAMDGYQSSLADVKFEQDLAADSMGVFGQAALETSAKLSAQQKSADGLRQSILALNDVNRSAYDAQIQFEGAIDDLAASFKKNGATLDLNTEKGRANAQAMSAAAKSQDELIASGLAAGESLGSMSKKSDELRSKMLKLATDAFDGNKRKAQDYVNTLLGAPGEIKTLVKLEKDEAVTGLKAVRAAFEAQPDTKTITVDALNGAAIKALEAVGLKTKQLPDGRTQVTTKNGSSLSAIDAVRRALSNLNGKTARTWTYHTVKTTRINETIYHTKGSLHDVVGATGGMFTGRGFRTHYDTGGLVQGPGTGTSDDVFAPWLSNGEFVMKAAAVRKYGEKFMQALNEGRLTMPRFASGGKVSSEARDARSSLRGQFGISSFGRLAGYQRTPFEKSLGAPSDVPALVDALNRASGDIKRATGGRTESRLLRQLNSVGKTLITYDKQLNKVNSSLEKARGKLDDLKSAASQLSDSVKSNILSSANITRAAGAEDSRVTINTILSQMRGSASNAADFDSALKALRKKGLSSDLLSQIAQAGIEGGGLETAQALLGGSSDQIRTLNSLQNQIAKSAASAGATTADAVYGGAIKAQAAYVSMLAKSQERLEKAMASLAKVMEKAISRAVGRKAAGGIVGGAASGGVRGGMTWVGEQGPELLDLPAGARVWSSPDSRRMASAPWASMLTTRHGRTAARGGSAAAEGSRPIVLNVHLGTREFGQIWVDVGRKEVKTRGGLTATLGS